MVRQAIFLAVLVLGATEARGQLQRIPDVENLHAVAPYEVSPQYLAGIALNGNSIWGTIYLKGKIYARFDLAPKERQERNERNERKEHIGRPRWTEHPLPQEGAYGSVGGICILDKKLWVATTDGLSIACYDLKSMKREQHFTFPRYSEASQSFGGLTHDGKHLWAEWHTHGKDNSKGPGQLLLKLSPSSGAIVASHPITLGDRADTARGLEWDGSALWLAYDKSLVAINPKTGRPTKTYQIPDVLRPSGLAWDESGMWIGEFTGKLWHLPFHRQ